MYIPFTNIIITVSRVSGLSFISWDSVTWQMHGITLQDQRMDMVWIIYKRLLHSRSSPSLLGYVR